MSYRVPYALAATPRSTRRRARFRRLRIAVNDELGALRDGLEAAFARTATGGRIAAISFHSLEDRIVKHRFREDARVRPVTRKPIVAGDDELAGNPRARSAKLRVAERIDPSDAPDRSARGMRS